MTHCMIEEGYYLCVSWKKNEKGYNKMKQKELKCIEQESLIFSPFKGTAPQI